MRNYQYLAAFDIDEIIVPLLDYDWSKLMQRLHLLAGVRDSYYVTNIYFLDSLQKKMIQDQPSDIPKCCHMMRHIWRTQNYTNDTDFLKSFHNTDKVLAMHNHLPMKCLYGENYLCDNYQINTTFARLQHYRQNCLGHLSEEQCEAMSENPVRDITLWKWKDEVIARTRNTLKKLNLLIE